MELKEIYSKMSDKELMERLENSDTYFDDAKEIIVDEVLWRKLKTKEEIEEIVANSIEKISKKEIKNCKTNDLMIKVFEILIGIIFGIILMCLLIPIVIKLTIHLILIILLGGF